MERVYSSRIFKQLRWITMTLASVKNLADISEPQVLP